MKRRFANIRYLRSLTQLRCLDASIRIYDRFTNTNLSVLHNGCCTHKIAFRITSRWSGVIQRMGTLFLFILNLLTLPLESILLEVRGTARKERIYRHEIASNS